MKFGQIQRASFGDISPACPGRCYAINALIVTGERSEPSQIWWMSKCPYGIPKVCSIRALRAQCCHSQEQSERLAGRKETPRQPSLRMQFGVMRRDNFRCVKCGRHPQLSLDQSWKSITSCLGKKGAKCMKESCRRSVLTATGEKPISRSIKNS